MVLAVRGRAVSPTVVDPSRARSAASFVSLWICGHRGLRGPAVPQEDPRTRMVLRLSDQTTTVLMFLNGTAVASLDGNAFTSLHTFDVTSGFVAGVNTLSFTVAEDGSDGLLISQISGTADAAGSVALPTQTICPACETKWRCGIALALQSA